MNEQIKLDPESALVNVDKAISQLQGTRETHLYLQNCIMVLREVTTEWRKLIDTEDSKKEEKPKKGR